MLDRITDFSSSRRGKWIVIAIWLLVAAVVVPLAPSLSDVTNDDSSTFLPDDAEATEVDRLVRAIETETFDAVIVSPGVVEVDPNPSDAPWPRISRAVFGHYQVAYRGGEVNLLTRRR